MHYNSPKSRSLERIEPPSDKKFSMFHKLKRFSVTRAQVSQREEPTDMLDVVVAQEVIPSRFNSSLILRVSIGVTGRSKTLVLE